MDAGCVAPCAGDCVAAYDACVAVYADGADDVAAYPDDCALVGAGGTYVDGPLEGGGAGGSSDRSCSDSSGSVMSLNEEELRLGVCVDA